MLETYTVSFFGHRKINNLYKLENQLESLIMNVIDEHAFVEFLVGNNGDFDQICSSTVRRIKLNYRDENSCLSLILPYSNSNLGNNLIYLKNYYDEIEICEEASRAHFKAAIQIRNKSMVDRSNLVICYIETNSGGAFKTIEYARKCGKEIINLYEK